MGSSDMDFRALKPFTGTIWRVAVFASLLILVCMLLPTWGSSTWFEKEQRIKVDLTGELMTLDRKPTSLKDLKGEVLFLNFWATWCGPCLMELPSMATLHDRFARKGLEIVAITNEDPETVNRFLEQYPMPFRVLIDREDKLARRLRIWSIPMTLILDRQGKLAHFHQGARFWDTPDVLGNLQVVLEE